jgi:diacylglycerol O-acyltransferase / wax synthase
MKRLSFVDALFLYLETPETPMHIGSVTIFKPPSPQDDLFARFREHTAARLDLLPSYRRRLEPTPLGIDHPAWVIEDKLDLDYHIRHETLLKPGGMAELRALIGQLHAVALDRSRPLWEYHFIEGLEGGAFAVYGKVHHSMMDGLAGMATLGVTFDFAPGAGHETLPQRIVPPDVEPSDFIELTSTAVGDFIRQGWRAVTGLPGVAQSLAKVAPNFGRDARFLFSYVKDMPRTPFNAAISGHRVYATASLPLPEVKALAKSRGVTINDVVLALCAGALRRYLAEHAALPEKALTAGVPVSIRPLGDAKLNVQVFFTLSRLPTDVAEPLPRLAAAQTAGHEAKNLFSDMRDLVTTDISILGAPLVVTGLARLWAGAGAYKVRPFFNVIVSNVPGPRQTMYCVGAPATHYFPVSIPYHGCALNMTVHSYLDQLDFGLVACSETVPDAQRIADYIAEDFAAMRKADAELSVETITAAPAAAPRAAHKPIALGEAKLESRPQMVEKTSAVTQQIDALGEATEALLRRLEKVQPAAPAKRRAGKKAETSRKRAASKPAVAERALPKAAPARPKRTRAGESAKSGRRRSKGAAPAQSEA